MTAAQDIAPLVVAVPLLAAALILITNFAPRRVHDALGLAASAAVVVLCVLLLAETRHGYVVVWLGGWRPHHGVATGISMTVDQLGAGMAMLVAALMTCALAYAWVYFGSISGLFQALMLTFLAAMTGFCLSGDLFNMVVFFVLMGVAAYGLTAFEIGQRGPIQGAINFAVTNSIAGFAALMAVGLLYARTGALNLAQIGLALGHRADALVAVALALIGLAFLTKAAVTPLHFWLADAHAVAPTPVSAVFSGVMAELGIFGVARLLATAFAGPLASSAAGVRAVLVGAGVVTALVGALACFEQRHVKRMLGFATVAHIGVILCGVALLDDRALAGAALYTLGFGAAVAALFMATGVLVVRHGTIDEYDLHGLGRSEPAVGAAFAAGALALACAPLTATYFGAADIAGAAQRLGYGWLPFALSVAWALTAAAALRIAGRVFCGWGAAERTRGSPDESEERAQEQAAAEEGSGSVNRDAPTLGLLVVPALLIAVALLAGLVPGVVPSVERAAGRFRDFAGYRAAVLGGRPPAVHVGASVHVGGLALALSCAATLAAFAIAALALFGRGLAERLPRPLIDAPLQVIDMLRAAHSGHVGDYVAWWTFGAALLGGLFLWQIAG